MGYADTFELQFHTEQSLEVKMNASHKLYEAFRSPSITTDSERLEVYAQMKAVRA